MEVEVLNEESNPKKGRHRKKQLYTSILQQMEFYFSDSNLSKDRFLGKLLKNDPCKFLIFYFIYIYKTNYTHEIYYKLIKTYFNFFHG